MYPYEHIGSFKKFFEDQLPSMCEFFSYLRDECISERDYSHTINVWNTSKMGDYQDLFLKTVALLLTIFFKVYQYVIRILWTRSLSFF